MVWGRCPSAGRCVQGRNQGCGLGPFLLNCVSLEVIGSLPQTPRIRTSGPPGWPESRVSSSRELYAIVPPLHQLGWELRSTVRWGALCPAYLLHPSSKLSPRPISVTADRYCLFLQDRTEPGVGRLSGGRCTVSIRAPCIPRECGQHGESFVLVHGPPMIFVQSLLAVQILRWYIFRGLVAHVNSQLPPSWEILAI